jgi:hypothetical protein
MEWQSESVTRDKVENLRGSHHMVFIDLVLLDLRYGSRVLVVLFGLAVGEVINGIGEEIMMKARD